MNARIARCSGWWVAAALLCAPAMVYSAEPAAKVKAALEAKRDGSESMDAMDARPKPSGKADKSAEPDTRVYRFKAEKKGALGEAQAIILSLEDMLTGKTENVPVANADPKKFGPVPAVADAMKEITPGDLVEVRTERQRGRSVALSLAKAKVTAGEDRPKGYVYLGWDRKKDKDGKTVMGLKLKKFGREVVVMVPLKLDTGTGDWNPPGQVDYVLNRVQPGEAVEADIKPGNPPVLERLWEYYRPERGKFIGLTDMDYQGFTALAIEMTGEDGTKLRIRVPGTQTYKNGKKVMMPDPAQLAMLRRIKPESEIEVYTNTRNDYVLREINVLAPPSGEKSGKSASEKASKSSDEKSASAK